MKWSEQLGQLKGIGPALKIRQFHTIEHRVSKIIAERYREGNKTPAILRGSAARRRISIPMCNHSTTCDTYGTYGTGRAPQSGCIGLHLILYSIHSTATDRRCAMSQSSLPPVKKQAPFTTRSNSLRCVSAAEHHTAEQYSKMGRTKPRKHLSRSNLS